MRSLKSEQLKFPEWSYPEESTVKQENNQKVPSLSSARVKPLPCGKENNLMEKILERDNMQLALKKVEGNKGCGGTDGMEIGEFRKHLKENWVVIKENLLRGTYNPHPVKQVEIRKSDGGIRKLGIPTLTDRLIEQAIMQVMTPIFEPEFSDSSYGFRPGRNAHQAIEAARDYIKDGYRYVVDMDIEKFFDKVNHDILMSKLGKEIGDKRLLKLIGKYLRSGIMSEGNIIGRTEGTPQGSPLSPLLSNIMLNELDKELAKRGHRFVRYADDCNIYVKSHRAGLRVMENTGKFLERKLKLSLNQNKSGVDLASRRTFLGINFINQAVPRVRISIKAKNSFKRMIRKLTKRSHTQNLESRISRLNSYLRGWIGYFRIADTPSIFPGLDGWIRRRLRVCLLKQWKLPKTKIRELKALGIDDKSARMIGNSGRGCWMLSNTVPVSMALNNDYWKKQGLVNLTDSYSKARQSL